MARRSRSTGVGRGNGPGSAKTQFRPGMPPPEGSGRKKKAKPVVPRSLSKAVEVEFSRLILVEEGGDKAMMPLFQAMVKALGADFEHASVFEKIRILNWMIAQAPELLEERDPEPSEETARKVVERLAEHARRMDPNYEPVWQ